MEGLEYIHNLLDSELDLPHNHGAAADTHTGKYPN